MHDVTTELDADLRRWSRPTAAPRATCSCTSRGSSTAPRTAAAIQVDPEQVRTLQDLNRRYPVALLPSHRSYIDPVVLASVLQRAEPAAHLQARRHQRVVLAHGSDGTARRPHLHPAQLPRRPGVQARAAGVRGLARRAPPEPRVVHRGRPHPHRQAARPPPRAARLPRRRGARRPLRRLRAPAGVDRLRRAARRRGARAVGAGRGQGTRVVRPARRATRGRSAPATRAATSTSRSASRSRCATTSPASSTEAADGQGEPDALPLQKLAFEVAVRINTVTPITPPALITMALLWADRALTVDQLLALLDALRRLRRPARHPGHVHVRSRRATPCCAVWRRCSATAWSRATTTAARSCT